MWRLVRWIGQAMQYLLRLVLPMFKQARGSAAVGNTVRWILHLLLLAAFLVGCYYVGRYFDVGASIPNFPTVVRDNWLVILAVLVYLELWLGWWLWKLLITEEERSYFPKIDEAWEEGMAALARVRLDVRDLPLFLILGRPASGEENLFQAAQLSLDVKGVPDRPDAPVRVYANREAVYVTCVGASLTGQQAEFLAKQASHEPGAQPHVEEEPAPEGGVDETMKPTGQVRKLQLAAKVGDQREILVQLRQNNPAPVLKDLELKESFEAKLEHLCRLMARDRQPFCPVNGILLLIPFAGTDSDKDAFAMGQVCEADLAVARRTLRVHCPLITMVCDMESAAGFPEFISRFEPKDRKKRIGQRCPLVPSFPDGDPETAATAMVNSLVSWVCHSTMPVFVYQKFKLEKTGEVDLEHVVKSNAQLFLLASQLRERQQRLSTILNRAVATSRGGPPAFGGCYLAGTGRESGKEQAFVRGVLSRLKEEENCVAWTEAALAEESAYQRWVSTGWTALAVLVVAAVGGMGFYFWKRNG